MKFPFLLLSTISVCAGEKTVQVVEPAPVPAWSLKVDAAWVGDGDFDRGGHGSVAESRFQIAMQRGLDLPLIGGLEPRWVLRLGVEWERFGFDNSKHAPSYLPGTLQSTALLIGLEYRTKAGLGALFEARPGLFFEHDARLATFDIPAKAAIVWQISDRFALIGGVIYAGHREHPILPVAGIYWKISDTVLLNAIPPDPRLEFILSEQTRLWLGAELAGGGYRTDSGRTDKLNAAVVSYTDYRASAGVQWKLAPTWLVEAGAGVSFQREFDFHRAGVEVESDDLAPFVRFSLRGEW